MEALLIILYALPIIMAAIFMRGGKITVGIEIDRLKFNLRRRIDYRWILFIPGLNLLVLYQICYLIFKERN